MSDPREKIIFALDVEHFSEAQQWVKLLKNQVGLFKVGKAALYPCGAKGDRHDPGQRAEGFSRSEIP